jgi:hypothetical protein
MPRGGMTARSGPRSDAGLSARRHAFKRRSIKSGPAAADTTQPQNTPLFLPTINSRANDQGGPGPRHKTAANPVD